MSNIPPGSSAAAHGIGQSPTSLTKAKRLLVYRYGQIGDFVASVPALLALKANFPGARLTLLSEVPQTSDSLPPEKVLPSELVDEYLKYRGGTSLKNLTRFAFFLLSLRRRHFDLLVYLVPSTRDAKRRRRDALFFRLAGIHRIIGMKGFPDDPFPRGAGGSLGEVEHETDALLRRLAADGVNVPAPGEAVADLGLTSEERQSARSWLTEHLPAGGAVAGWFALSPGSKWASKRWPYERFRELTIRLWREQHLFPVIVGGAEDKALGERLIEACGAGACAAGELSVRQSAALLELALFYVGNDSGPMHLAAAVATPCVAIFSAQDWRGRWHPYGKGHEVLRLDVPCAGCFSAHCRYQLECLSNIDATKAYEACLRVLRGSTVAPVRLQQQEAIA